MKRLIDESMTGQERFDIVSERSDPSANRTAWARQYGLMGVPTVFLVGETRLPLVPEYLNLGSVVVIAPDRGTLRSWQTEQLDAGASDVTRLAPASTVVDIEGRRILSSGESLPLSELEFRVLGALLDPAGRAWSFAELRRVGWGDGPEMPVDPYTVKALVQRLRAKLASARAEISIEAVRGFGFRLTTVAYAEVPVANL